MTNFVLGDSVVYRKEADGALIYNHATGIVTPLNATAAYLCESLFINREDPEKALAGIKVHWRVTDEEAVKSDIARFIIGMKQLGLIEEKGI